MSTHPLTQSLYQDLRVACLSRKDDEAYTILKQILEIDSQDSDAEQQLKETGQRLSVRLLDELPEALAGGDVNVIEPLVSQLRDMAEADFLRGYPDFVAAAAMVDAATKEKNTGLLLNMMRQLETLEGISARHTMATSVEKFVTGKALVLSDAQLALVAACHRAWDAQQVHEQALAALAEVDNALDLIDGDLHEKTSILADEKLDAYQCELTMQALNLEPLLGVLVEVVEVLNHCAAVSF